MAITDIYHYLELTDKISASDRCKLSMLESDLLKKRRKIKDDMYTIKNIKEMLNNGFVKPEVTPQEDRKYAPRILNELFEKHDIPKVGTGLFSKILQGFKN